MWDVVQIQDNQIPQKPQGRGSVSVWNLAWRHGRSNVVVPTRERNAAEDSRATTKRRLTPAYRPGRIRSKW